MELLSIAWNILFFFFFMDVMTVFRKIYWFVHNVKGKAVPLQAWSGPDGSRKLRFPDFMTTAQDGCKVVSLTHRPPLPTRNAPGTTFLLEAESTPGP